MGSMLRRYRNQRRVTFAGGFIMSIAGGGDHSGEDLRSGSCEGSGLPGGNRDGNPGPFPQLAFDGNGAAVQPDELPRIIEAEAESANLAGRCRVYLIKLFED